MNALPTSIIYSEKADIAGNPSNVRLPLIRDYGVNRTALAVVMSHGLGRSTLIAVLCNPTRKTLLCSQTLFNVITCFNI
jgi:hypothetical protein